MQTVSFVPLLLWFHLLAITIFQEREREPKSAGGVVHNIGSSDNVIFTFTGPGGGRHVTRAGGLLGRPRGAWPRSGLTVICGRRGERRGFLLGGRVVGGLLLGVGGQHGVEALFHFAEAGLECGELLVCLGDVVLSGRREMRVSKQAKERPR